MTSTSSSTTSVAMTPSVLHYDTTSQLADVGMTHTIAKTAPSIQVKSVSVGRTLAELDASKLIVSLNPNPKSVPEPDSPEVWSQSV